MTWSMFAPQSHCCSPAGENKKLSLSFFMLRTIYCIKLTSVIRWIFFFKELPTIEKNLTTKGQGWGNAVTGCRVTPSKNIMIKSDKKSHADLTQSVPCNVSIFKVKWNLQCYCTRRTCLWSFCSANHCALTSPSLFSFLLLILFMDIY